VIPSKLHPCHLERGGPPPMHYAGGSGCSYLGGRMQPLSNHDMAKLVRATGTQMDQHRCARGDQHP
jgi:hypothetical protein